MNSTPYFGLPSEHIAELLKLCNIKTAFRPGHKLSNLLFNFKPKAKFKIC